MRSLVVLISSVVLTSSIRAQSIDATIDRATAAYAKVRTARATFEQTLTNPLTGNTSVQRGEVQQQMPNRLAVSFTDPKGDRIVADGKSLWIYTPSVTPGQVVKLPLSAGGAGSVDLAGQFFEEPRRRFEISDAGTLTLDGRATHALTLVPKGETASRQPSFAKAVVWIDDADGTLRQFEVTEATGLVRRVHLTKIVLNAPVNKAAFKFSPPRGTKVYDQAALTGSI
jgi:outer membrane lipoprotein carrier protein